MPSSKNSSKYKNLAPNKPTKSKNSGIVASKRTKNSEADVHKAASRSKLPNVFRLSEKAILTLDKDSRSFAIVTIIYFLLTFLLVRGLQATTNVIQLKTNVVAKSGHTNIGSDVHILGHILSSSVSANSATSNLYQTFLFIIFSMVFIWMVREVYSGTKLKIRDSFYKSQTALIPFVIILFLLIVELIPMLVALYLYAIVFRTGIAVQTPEKILWIIGDLALVGLSIFLIINTIFALYIVTLPDVRPVQALRTNRRLVKKRRMLILRKVLFLPIVSMIIIGLISLFAIAVIPKAADYIFMILISIFVVVTHSYLYNLYREMI